MAKSVKKTTPKTAETAKKSQAGPRASRPASKKASPSKTITAKKATPKKAAKKAAPAKKSPSPKEPAAKGVASKGTHAAAKSPTKAKAAKSAKPAAKSAQSAAPKTASKGKATKPAPAAKKPAPAKKASTKKSAPKATAKPTKPGRNGDRLEVKDANAADDAGGRFQSSTSFDFDFGPKVGSEERNAQTAEETAARRRPALSAKDRDHFRQLLLLKRAELLGDMSSMEAEALRGEDTNLSHLADAADVGTDQYEQEFTLDLVRQERELLAEIDHALRKLDRDDGSYGICEGTGRPIGKPRLEAHPWARHSIEFARARERGRSPILQPE